MFYQSKFLLVKKCLIESNGGKYISCLAIRCNDRLQTKERIAPDSESHDKTK